MESEPVYLFYGKKKVSCYTWAYLISKLEFICSHHVDVVVNGQDTLGLDLLIRVEAVAELVLPRLHYLQGHTDLGPR